MPASAHKAATGSRHVAGMMPSRFARDTAVGKTPGIASRLLRPIFLMSSSTVFITVKLHVMFSFVNAQIDHLGRQSPDVGNHP